MIEALLCLVVAISDGDTLKARCGDPGAFQQVTVRLAEIDAPEKGQAFGQRSKRALAALCFRVRASIQPKKIDRYGRTVARVRCDGKDASSSQVAAGMAWFFTRYGTDPSIRALEDGARAERRGLWADPAPVAPWDWRRAQKGALAGSRAELFILRRRGR